MSEGPDTTLLREQAESPAEPPGGLVTGLRSFASEHDGVKAIIEYAGRRGARIVLVGEDGVWADKFAPATDVARHACATAGVPVENGWERELMSQMRPSDEHRRPIVRRSLARLDQ